MLNCFVVLASFVTQRLGRDERGATAVEYGLMVALIAAAIALTVGALGGALNTLYQNVITSL